MIRLDRTEKPLAALIVVTGLVMALSLFPSRSSAVTCGAGTLVGGGCVVFLTSGTSWTVPADWDNASNTVETIGAGGSGGAAVGGSISGGGGGGGAYSKATNVSLTVGASVTYKIGSGGGGAGSGDSYFCNSTSNCASLAGTAVVAGAQGGSNASGGSAGSGGASSSGVGSTKYSGGSGGSAGGSGGGGGGAASSHGAGATGGNGSGAINCSPPYGGTDYGGGGGGSGGGTAGSQGNCSSGNGGNNYLGAGGGTGGGAGSQGGGGSGGPLSNATAGAGGAGIDWDSTHGAGGGAGGAGRGYQSPGNGGTGGLYGGGGGGAGESYSATGSAGSGAQGIVVLTYTPAPGTHSSVEITKSTVVTGSVSVVGALSKGSGTFVIDHPLDPKNKLLYHSFVESPDVLNIYDGIVQLDDAGKATVRLPDYFLALNEDFQYLATAIGQPMPDLHLSAEVRRRFFIFGQIQLSIAGGAPGGRVSWQVTGIRHDPFIRANPIIPEVEKGPGELVDKGEYLFPNLYAQ